MVPRVRPACTLHPARECQMTTSTSYLSFVLSSGLSRTAVYFTALQRKQSVKPMPHFLPFFQKKLGKSTREWMY